MADHIAWSRLVDSYRQGDADTALTTGRPVELEWMLRPASDLGLYLAEMRDWRDSGGPQGWVEANRAFARGILERIELDGPLTSRDLPDAAEIPCKPSSGWSNNRNVTKMLECLHRNGELAVIGREGRLRIWELAERVYPAVALVPTDEARRIRSSAASRCLRNHARQHRRLAPRSGWQRWVGVPVTVDGVAGGWLVDPARLEAVGPNREFEGRTAILSPFDRLLTDPQRVAKLFEFDYTLEITSRLALAGGRRVRPARPERRSTRRKGDARSDRESGRFIVHRIHEARAL